MTADVITFDTVSETAKLTNGQGASDEGVQRGLVHFSASDLHTDPDGVAHGSKPYVTTCENPRGGYHITGNEMEVYPGDRIVIHKATLWLGAAAVFFLPLLIIPLRTVGNERARTHWFPEVGYNSYEGAWIKIQIPFGKDQYYYGYYIVNYYTKEGLGLGYVGFYSSKRGRRSVSVNLYTINSQLAGERADECVDYRAGKLLAAFARQRAVLSTSQTTDRWSAFRQTKASPPPSFTKRRRRRRTTA